MPFVKFDHLKRGSFSPAKFKTDSGEGSNLAAETRHGNINFICLFLLPVKFKIVLAGGNHKPSICLYLNLIA